MLVHPNLFAALKQRHQAASASKIFKTPSHKLFIGACKLAFASSRQGHQGISAQHAENGEIEFFPFSACVLTMNGKQRRALESRFKKIWDGVADLDNFNQNMRLETKTDNAPVRIDSVSIEDADFIGQRLASIDSDLRLIIGDEAPTKLDLYNYTLMTNRPHVPRHSWAVMNETWGQNGVVILDEDLESPEQVTQGDRLFMPPLTPHRPPIAELGEVCEAEFRGSLISNEAVM